jgi:hypothetical protein
MEHALEYPEASRIGEASRQATKSIFAEEIVRLVTVLDKTGDRAAARENSGRCACRCWKLR